MRHTGLYTDYPVQRRPRTGTKLRGQDDVAHHRDHRDSYIGEPIPVCWYYTGRTWPAVGGAWPGWCSAEPASLRSLQAAAHRAT